VCVRLKYVAALPLLVCCVGALIKTQLQPQRRTNYILL
jgi:hypothetical protein